jgi:excisionase family DNA binding protein
MEKLMDKIEVADILAVKVKTLERWVQENRIPHVRLTPKCVRFIPSDIRAFLEKLGAKPGQFIAPPPSRPSGKPAASPARQTSVRNTRQTVAQTSARKLKR